MLAYELIIMPGTIENAANGAKWRLRGSLNENVGFLYCLTVSGDIDCIGVLYSSICVSRSHRNCRNALVKRPTNVFLLVHLYLRLSENVLPCDFHKHWGFLYIARRHFIVYDSGP